MNRTFVYALVPEATPGQRIVTVNYAQSGKAHLAGIDHPSDSLESAQSSVDYLNEQLGASREVVDSFVAGSMFGWHVPAAKAAHDYFFEPDDGRPDYSQTYWSHKGKHEDLNAALAKLVPTSGEVQNPDNNPALERFRIASNCYYDLYNNGLGNRAKEFRAVFNFSGKKLMVSGELTQGLINKTEWAMDEIILAAAKEQRIDPTNPQQRVERRKGDRRTATEAAVDRAEEKTGHRLDIIRHGKTQHSAERVTVENRTEFTWCSTCRDWFQPGQFIDITPRGCETVEGTRRVTQAQNEWDTATHELANRLKQEIDDIFDRSTNKISAAELYSEFQTLIGIRDVKQEAFLRAVAGVPDMVSK